MLFRSVKEKFSLTRSAVYMAVVALFSSGDFLVGAYSHENDLLIAVWEAHQQQVLASTGSSEVTTPITFKDESNNNEAQKQLLQSESQVPSLTLPPESATESKTLASGLVLPPESATVSPRAIKPVTQPAPPVSQKPVAITLSAKTTSSTDNLMPIKRSVVNSSRTVLNSVDLKSASDTYFKPTVLPTVQIAELTESQKKKQATLICTPAQAQSEQNTVIEQLINEQPRNKVILASLGPNTQPVRLSQAPVETAQAPNAASKPGSSVAATSSPAPSSTPTASVTRASLRSKAARWPMHSTCTSCNRNNCRPPSSWWPLPTAWPASSCNNCPIHAARAINCWPKARAAPRATARKTGPASICWLTPCRTANC